MPPRIREHLRSRPEQDGKRQVIVRFILQYFGFDSEWLARTVLPAAKGNKDGYLKLQPDSSNLLTVHNKLVLFSEALWNLGFPMPIKGFLPVLKKWNAHLGEGEYNEAFMAANLRRYGIPFEFHDGSDGFNYDFKVASMSGEVICVEAKSRISRRERNWKALRNKMKEAVRTQLPATEPSAVFAQVPIHWVTGSQDDIDRQLKGFLTKCTRIVNVTIMSHFVHVADDHAILGLPYFESESRLHKFERNRIFAIFGPKRGLIGPWTSLDDIIEMYLSE